MSDRAQQLAAKAKGEGIGKDNGGFGFLDGDSPSPRGAANAGGGPSAPKQRMSGSRLSELDDATAEYDFGPALGKGDSRKIGDVPVSPLQKAKHGTIRGRGFEGGKTTMVAASRYTSGIFPTPPHASASPPKSKSGSYGTTGRSSLGTASNNQDFRMRMQEQDSRRVEPEFQTTVKGDIRVAVNVTHNGLTAQNPPPNNRPLTNGADILVTFKSKNASSATVTNRSSQQPTDSRYFEQFNQTDRPHWGREPVNGRSSTSARKSSPLEKDSDQIVAVREHDNEVSLPVTDDDDDIAATTVFAQRRSTATGGSRPSTENLNVAKTTFSSALYSKPSSTSEVDLQPKHGNATSFPHDPIADDLLLEHGKLARTTGTFQLPPAATISDSLSRVSTSFALSSKPKPKTQLLLSPRVQPLQDKSVSSPLLTPPVRTGAGFRNIGNTCYAGAVLTLLLRSTHISNAIKQTANLADNAVQEIDVRLTARRPNFGLTSFLNFSLRRPAGSASAASEASPPPLPIPEFGRDDFLLHRKLRELCIGIETRTEVSPFGLHEAFTTFFDNQMHDAQEFLTILVDSLEFEAKKIQRAAKELNLPDTTTTSAVPTSGLWKPPAAECWTDQVLTSLIVEKVQCQNLRCEHHLNKIETSVTVTLPLDFSASQTQQLSTNGVPSSVLLDDVQVAPTQSVVETTNRQDSVATVVDDANGQATDSILGDAPLITPNPSQTFSLLQEQELVGMSPASQRSLSEVMPVTPPHRKVSEPLALKRGTAPPTSSTPFKTPTVQEIFDTQFAERPLEGYKCDRCHQVDRCTKTGAFANGRTPPVLLISLLRYTPVFRNGLGYVLKHEGALRLSPVLLIKTYRFVEVPVTPVKDNRRTKRASRKRRRHQEVKPEADTDDRKPEEAVENVIVSDSEGIKGEDTEEEKASQKEATPPPPSPPTELKPVECSVLLYQLCGIVIHLGSTPTSGHYIARVAQPMSDRQTEKIQSTRERLAQQFPDSREAYGLPSVHWIHCNDAWVTCPPIGPSGNPDQVCVNDKQSYILRYDYVKVLETYTIERGL